MPLKILLADDSATIKKVVQLSLQDFGADVRSISSGKDVLDVAKSFTPDIAFIDVLLPHKTGYEVAAEMKKDGVLKNTPVVMMWSAFMSLDEAKFKESGADDRLEKPFEIAGLRQLINKYVPKTLNNPISKHLEFPNIDFDDGKVVKAQSTATKEATVSAPADKETGWNMSSFEDITQFAAEETVKAAGSPEFATPAKSPASGWPDETEWVQKDISKFRVNIPEEGMEDGSFVVVDSQIKPGNILKGPEKVSEPAAPVFTPMEPEPKVDLRPEIKKAHTPSPEPEIVAPVSMAQPTRSTPPPISPEEPAHAPTLAMSETEVRKFITEEVERLTREVIEKVVWQAVPDIATNLIKEELKRLLDTENPPL